MKLFKNGISVKWLLLILGIITSLGISYAAPIIGTDITSTRFFNGTVFYDTDNTAYYIDPSNTGTSMNTAGIVQAAGINTTAPIKLSGTQILALVDPTSPDGVIRLGNPSGGNNNDIQLVFGGSVYGHWYRNGTWSYSGWNTTSGTDTILCIDPSSSDITKNTGSATTCAASAEKYKNIKGTFNDSTIHNKFPQLHPIVFDYKEDIKHLENFGFNANEVAVQYPQTVYTRYQGKGTFVKVILNQSNPNKADSIQYSDGTIASIEGINYEMFFAILVNQVQNQQFQLETQASQIRNICTNNPQLCS